MTPFLSGDAAAKARQESVCYLTNLGRTATWLKGSNLEKHVTVN